MANKKKNKKKRFKLQKVNAQYYFEQMLKIYPLVAKILRTELETRDDDNILDFRVWKRQGAKENMSFKQLKYKVIMGKYASPSTIERSRRRLQEKNPELRGKLYKQRHNAEKDMRNQMKLDL